MVKSGGMIITNWAYYSLDLLDIKKDKLSKKSGVSNLLNDGLHSFYGQYCD